MDRDRLTAWVLLALAYSLVGQRARADEAWLHQQGRYPYQGLVIPVGHHVDRNDSPRVELAFRQREIVQPGPHVPTEQLPAASMSLEDLERIALEFNPTLVQAHMVVRAAQGQYLQAGLCPNPTIGYAGGDMGIEGTAGQQGATVGQEIVTAGKLRLGRAVAGHAVQGARYGLESQQQRVLNDVRSGYYEVLLAQRMIDVNRQLVQIGQEGVNVTEQLRAAQEVSEADVLQARIEAEVTALSLHEAHNRYQAAWQRLSGLLGQPEMERVTLVGDLEAVPWTFEWDGTLTRLWNHSPELAQAHSRVAQARCEVALQCAEKVPNFEVEAWAKHDATTEEGLVDVAISLPLPLFNRNQGNITRAHAELIAAQHGVRRVELELRDRLAASFEQYANARRKAESYRSTVLPYARRSRDMVSAGYREGEFGYLALLTAQRTFFNVSLEYLASLRELWTQATELQGMLLSGGLEEPK